MLDDNYMCFIYLSADLITKALPLRMFSVDFTWSISLNFTSGYVQWFLSELQFHGLHLTFFSMDFTLLDIQFKWNLLDMICNDFYLSWYSITFTRDCFPWALLLIVFNGLTWDTPQLNFIWDCLKGTWDAIQRTLLETVFNILYLRLSLVNFVGDDVQKTAIVPTLCMYLCLCVCQVSCIFLRIPDFINEDAVDFTTNVTKKLWSVARNYCAPLVCFKCTAFAFLKNVMCLHVIW